MGDCTMFGSPYGFNRNGTYQHYWTQDAGSGATEYCDVGAETVATPDPMNPMTPETTIQDATQNANIVQGEGDVTLASTTVAPTTDTQATPTPTTSALVTDCPKARTPS
ncbi:hypothetical protein PHMEG_00016453 [Phytophthora megakarya]|uniref:Uncharacterized protein n=1 Tax=Phytophthora megakarya TaxID=4795 RepID=A0A225VYT2_9STRA|nr:hypothetical protein PHMEG_00016453 [Phytophthora megakarya]